MVIVVAGMQAISREVLEAAEVFGATLWQRIRYVILPLLRPSLQVALILRTILALQVFAVVIALGGGEVVTVLANETYRQYDSLRNPKCSGSVRQFYFAAFDGYFVVLSSCRAHSGGGRPNDDRHRNSKDELFKCPRKCEPSTGACGDANVWAVP